MTNDEQRFQDYVARALFWAGVLVGATIGIFGTASIFILIEWAARHG